MTFNLSFYIWVLRSFCRDLPVELEEAAAMRDGLLDCCALDWSSISPAIFGALFLGFLQIPGVDHVVESFLEHVASMHAGWWPFRRVLRFGQRTTGRSNRKPRPERTV